MDLSVTKASDLTPEQIAKLREMGKQSLYFFAKGILGRDWLSATIHKPICRMLENSANRRMAVILPRSWLKSTLVTVAYPLWRAVRDPNYRVLIVQNTYDNAVKKLAEIKSIVEKNDLFRALYADVLPDATSKWRTDSACFKRTGTFPESTFEAAGTRTQVTSRHYDDIIEDDTVAPSLDDLGVETVAPSKEDIDQAIGWHRQAFPLLADPKTSRIIIVGTRWFQHDLLSWIRENEPSYVFHTRAVRENENGEADENGTVTYPERFDDDVLTEIKAAVGVYMFSCLYLNKPINPDTMVFKQDWVKFYDFTPKNVVYFTTVDPASDSTASKSKSSKLDDQVVMTCGKDLDSGQIFVIRYDNFKGTPSDLIAKIFDHVALYRPVVVGIEANAYQNTIQHWLRQTMVKRTQFFNVQLITNTVRTKAERIRGLQPLFESGAIFVRPSMTELVKQLLDFPLGKHDDIIDCLAMQLKFWYDTKSRQDEKPVDARDPFSFEAVVEEIEQRQSRVFGGIDTLFSGEESTGIETFGTSFDSIEVDV